MKLSEEEKEELAADEIQVATVLGRRAFFSMTIFDMGVGKDPI